MSLSKEQIETLDLLTEAANRAELLSILENQDADDYFRSMGILDDDAIHAFVHEHNREIMRGFMLLSRNVIDVPNLMGTAMLFGISVGYQMALLREDSE